MAPDEVDGKDRSEPGAHGAARHRTERGGRAKSARVEGRTEKRTLGVLMIVAGALSIWTASPVWVPVFLGVLLAVVASPLQRRLERRHRRHPRLLAAGISSATVALGIGLVVFMTYFVVREILVYLTDVAPRHAASFARWLHSERITHLLHRVGQTPDGLMHQVEGYGRSAVTHLTDIVGGVLAATSHGILVVIFTTITSYYLLLEGPALARFVVRMVPLPQPETRALMHEFYEVAVGTLIGIGVIALVQGTMAGVGYWIFGVHKPLVWASLTAVASLLPAIGTGLICWPIVAALVLSGHVWQGLGLLVYWGTVVTGLPDYWLRPRLMKGHMRLHELLVLIAVFGGIEAFGPIGIVLGPMFVAMFVALLRIYDRNYRPPSTEGRLRISERREEERREEQRRKDEEQDAQRPGPHGSHPQPA
jgi:predicted PurR-regulated permease PerM